MRFATADETGRWDELVASNPDGGNMLQSAAWAEIKRLQGWRPRYCVAETDSGDAAVLFLEKTIPGLGKLWYAPKGPGAAAAADALLAVEPKNPLFSPCFCVQIEPEIPASEIRAFERAGWERAPNNVQLTVHSMVLGLGKPLADLRAGYTPKGRYNAGVARRHGVEIESGRSEDAMEALFHVVAATLGRSRYTVRTKEDFLTSWRAFVARGQGEVYLARYGQTVVAGAFVVTLGKKAWYKDGGSLAVHRNVMAPYLLHDTVIERLSGAGYASYDFGSVPPEGSGQEHPLAGLSQFKRAFGGKVESYVGTLDLRRRRLRYALWEKGASKIALRVHAARTGSSFY